MSSVNPLAARLWKFCREVGCSGGEKCPVVGPRQLQASRDISYLTHFSILTSVSSVLVSVVVLSINPASSVFYPPNGGIRGWKYPSQNKSCPFCLLISCVWSSLYKFSACGSTKTLP